MSSFLDFRYFCQTSFLATTAVLRQQQAKRSVAVVAVVVVWPDVYLKRRKEWDVSYFAVLDVLASRLACQSASTSGQRIIIRTFRRAGGRADIQKKEKRANCLKSFAAVHYGIYSNRMIYAGLKQSSRLPGCLVRTRWTSCGVSGRRWRRINERMSKAMLTLSGRAASKQALSDRCAQCNQ